MERVKEFPRREPPSTEQGGSRALLTYDELMCEPCDGLVPRSEEDHQPARRSGGRTKVETRTTAKTNWQREPSHPKGKRDRDAVESGVVRTLYRRR